MKNKWVRGAGLILIGVVAYNVAGDIGVIVGFILVIAGIVQLFKNPKITKQTSEPSN